MSGELQTTIACPQRPAGQPELLLPLSLAAGGLVLLATQQPLLALAGLLALPAGYLLLARPEASTLLVAFILYSNAAVVAMRFHGVPFAVAAAFPLLLLLPLAYYLLVRGQKILVDRGLVLLVLLVAVQLLGTLQARRPDVALQSLTDWIVEGALLYFLFLNVVRTPQTLRRVTWVLLLAGSLMASVSLHQHLTSNYTNHYGGFGQVAAADREVKEKGGRLVQKRLAGPVGNTNYYAQVLLLLVPLGLYRILGEGSGRARLLAVLATALILAAIALTKSRGGAVGLLLALLLMGSLGYLRWRHLAATAVGLLLVLAAFPQFRERVSALGEVVPLVATDNRDALRGADPATRGRWNEMLAAGRVFLEHPVLGVGPGMFRYYYREHAERVGIRVQSGPRQAHNLYLQLAAENGLVGLGLFGLLVGLTLHNLARARRRWQPSHPDLACLACGLFMALLIYLGTGLFLHMAFMRYFWLIMALAAAASSMVPDSEPAGPEATVTNPPAGNVS